MEGLLATLFPCCMGRQRSRRPSAAAAAAAAAVDERTPLLPPSAPVVQETLPAPSYDASAVRSILSDVQSQLLPLDSSTLFHADPPPTQTQGALVLTLDKRTRTVDIWGKDDPSSYSAALKKKQHEPKRLTKRQAAEIENRMFERLAETVRVQGPITQVWGVDDDDPSHSHLNRQNQS